MDLKYKIRVVKIYIEIYWLKLLFLFGVKRSAKEIPKGVYCYTPDVEKNRNKDKNDYSYYIKPCKYYRGLKDFNAGCAYVAYVGDDMLLGDQCKICGENDDW